MHEFLPSYFVHEEPCFMITIEWMSLVSPIITTDDLTLKCDVFRQPSQYILEANLSCLKRILRVDFLSVYYCREDPSPKMAAGSTTAA